MENFIHFGCWNNLNKKGNLKPVMDKLQSRLNNPDLPQIDFISVAGDNYYPDKLKSKKKTDGKKKIIKPDLLEMGFNMLPSDPDIYMILGNHDLETNTNPKKPTLFIRDENNAEDNAEDNCKILTMEQELSKLTNIKFVLYKDLMLSNGTLILMIDTSMYTMDGKKYLKCYNMFLGTDYDLSQLQKFQNSWILSTIEKYKDDIQNLVIIGHHPITGIKFKDDKEKHLNDIPFFIDILQEIYKLLSNTVYYYFLCADLHIYQKGYVYIELDREHSDSLNTELETTPEYMMIEQHIVGTGGTDLDDDLPNNVVNNFENDIISYMLDASIHSNGFLECNIYDEVLDFVFHSADKPKAGKEIKNKTKKHKTKKHKTKKPKSKKKGKRSKRTKKIEY